MAELKDSGNRREFESGAVRDMQEGKGRCDLLPLEVFIEEGYFSPAIEYIIEAICSFKNTGKYNYLHLALIKFINEYYSGDYYTTLLELAKHYEDGARKYGDENWKKGIPVNVYIDSAIRHLLKYLRGDKDEPHNRAFVWNVLCCIWTCINIPELNKYGK